MPILHVCDSIYDHVCLNLFSLSFVLFRFPFVSARDGTPSPQNKMAKPASAAKPAHAARPRTPDVSAVHDKPVDEDKGLLEDAQAALAEHGDDFIIDDDEDQGGKRVPPLTAPQILLFIQKLGPYYGKQRFKSIEAMCAHVLTELQQDPKVRHSIFFVNFAGCLISCFDHFTVELRPLPESYIAPATDSKTSTGIH